MQDCLHEILYKGKTVKLLSPALIENLSGSFAVCLTDGHLYTDGKYYKLCKDYPTVFDLRKPFVIMKTDKSYGVIITVDGGNAGEITNGFFQRPKTFDVTNGINRDFDGLSVLETSVECYKIIATLLTTPSRKDVNNFDFIDGLVGYVLNRIDRKLTLDDCASAVNVSKNHLENAFRDCVGLPVKRFIAEIKFLYSLPLVKDTELSVDEIAKKIGLNDSQVLIRLYNNELGVTPYKYRILSREKHE